MKRIRRGWALTKKSWALLNSHRELVRFPLYGGVATIVLGLVFLGPGVVALGAHTYGVGVPLIVIGIYVLSVVGIYFSVGLAACADPALILIVIGFVVWPTTGIGGGVLVVAGALLLCVALLISKALSGIFGVALYHYALDGEVLGGFTQGDLESAVRPKRGARLPGATPGTA